MRRIRISYRKKQELKYTGHLDIAKIWERYLRRSKLPLAYTEGFHPQPRMNQALPLPLGVTSCAEIMEIWLSTDCNLDEIESRLRSTYQPGIEINHIEEIDISAPKVQNLVMAAEYFVKLLVSIPIGELQQRIQDLLSSPTIFREKREKNYDLRPLVLELSLVPPDGCLGHFQSIRMKLVAKPGATGRADEVLAALSLDPSQTRIERQRIFLSSDIIPG